MSPNVSGNPVNKFVWGKACIKDELLFAQLECKDLILGCLRIDPSERIKLDEILQHPWMTASASATSGLLASSDPFSNPTPSTVASSAPTTSSMTSIERLLASANATSLVKDLPAR